MPWTAKTFRKHNRKGTPKSARVANALLRKGYSEGSAIRITNSAIKKTTRKQSRRPTRGK